MAKTAPRRNGYRQLEQVLTCAVIADLSLFILFLIASGFGVTWLKFVTLFLTLALSGVGILFLYVIDEYRKLRSRWIITSFVCILICALVSLIAGYPAPLPA